MLFKQTVRKCVWLLSNKSILPNNLIMPCKPVKCPKLSLKKTGKGKVLTFSSYKPLWTLMLPAHCWSESHVFKCVDTVNLASRRLACQPVNLHLNGLKSAANERTSLVMTAKMGLNFVCVCVYVRVLLCCREVQFVNDKHTRNFSQRFLYLKVQIMICLSYALVLHFMGYREDCLLV